MYLVYCLTLLLAVYLAPALALHPRMILESRTAVAIPFLSIAVILPAQFLLAGAGLYERGWVLAISGAFLAAALLRLWRLLRRRPDFQWPPTHRYLLLFACLLGLYWAADLGTRGFDTNDEIYSWNLWALQHWRSEAVDYHYTGAPYPQGFAVLLSWGYQLLGDAELQLPLRAPLALLPVALWAAIAMAPREATYPNALRGVLLMVLLMAAIGRWFDEGLADPLMASSLVLSIFLFTRFRDQPHRRDLLVLSVLCAGVALYSKQAALIWALLSFPLVLSLSVARRRLPATALAAGAATLGLGLAWVLGPGRGFENNPGVINASREGRGLLEQLLHAGLEQSLGQPLVPLLLAAALVAVTRSGKNRDIAWLFLAPATVAWLLYGAYSLRLGIHLVALAALLLALSAYDLPRLPGAAAMARAAAWLRPRWPKVTLVLALLVTGLAAKRVSDNVREVGERFSLYAAGPNTIGKYFGKDAELVLRETYDRPDRLLWVPSNYIWGIYYAHTPMMRPAARFGEEFSARELLRDIAAGRPDYLFDAGERVAFGPGSERLRELATVHCPFLFEARATPPNKYGYTLYALHDDRTLLERCERRLDPAAGH